MEIALKIKKIKEAEKISPGGDSNARSQDFSVEITVLRLKPTWLPRVIKFVGCRT